MDGLVKEELQSALWITAKNLGRIIRSTSSNPGSSEDVLIVTNSRFVGNSSITRRRRPTDSDRETTGKVRFARDLGGTGSWTADRFRYSDISVLIGSSMSDSAIYHHSRLEAQSNFRIVDHLIRTPLQ
jgi:hypothetical protein